ncbi:MAG: SpoIID/LytB domain-containing protein [Chloroflexi bacterium]|nr:SpoIID/LytB domain-containing protein [Chloroflexota bacterium]
MTWWGWDSARLSRRFLLRSSAAAGLTGLALLPGAARSAAPPPSGTGFIGQVVDLATLAPVAGALIRSDPLGLTTRSDAAGAYVLPAPPGSYTLHVSHDGYIETTLRAQVVASSGYTSVDLELLPSAPTPSQQEILYQRTVRQIQSPLVNLSAIPTPRLRIASVSLPKLIKVTHIPPNDTTQWVPLEDYVKGVVPNEVPASWPPAALQAQAVAARSYGVAHFLAKGCVCATTACQVYDPTRRYATTDAAVDATAGQVLTVDGSVIFAFFFSRCNGVSTRNSEDAIIYTGTNAQGQYICGRAGWKKLSYCRARCCSWNTASSLSTCGYYGHGVGLCQWGTYGQAQAGRSYTTILASYYTGVSLTGPGGTIALAEVAPQAAATGGSYKIYLPYVANGNASPSCS